LTSDNESSMIDQIQWLIDNPDERYKVWKRDYEKVKKDLFLEDNLLKWVNEHLKLFNNQIKG
jgi:spore maturation protein CgeB